MRSFTAAEQDEWLWGWDPTPGIVSVWAECPGARSSGGASPRPASWSARRRASVRGCCCPRSNSSATSAPTSSSAAPGEEPHGALAYHELEGPGRFAYYVSASDGRALESALLSGASRAWGAR